MRSTVDRFATLPATVAIIFCSLFFALPAHAGTQDNVEGWLWSGTIGWISLNCTSPTPATCATVDYGVTFEEVPGFPDRGDLKGWAWSENIGWICFGITCTGTSPEGAASYAQFRGSYVGELGATKLDQLYGWAKIDALGSNGWISLNCDSDPTTTCAASNYHVMLDTAPGGGDFTNGVINDHWGWNSSSDGIGVGWIDFSLGTTSWTQAELGTIKRPQGIYEPNNGGLAGTRLFTFTIGFDGISATEDDLLQCDVLRSNGTTVQVQKIFSSTVRDVSDSMQYTVTNPDPIDKVNRWEISACRLAGPRTTDCPCGVDQVCEGTKCRNVIVETSAPLPLYVHSNSWTFADTDTDDFYLATQCFARFPGKSFGNSWRCDFTADASFSLAMSLGVPIERECGDLIDNDGNGQIDCADRYCKGISYLCRTPPLGAAPVVLEPLACTWGASGDSLADCTAGFDPGDICCTKQNKIVDGYECFHGIANDGYIDCDDGAAVVGDVCCSVASEVQVK